MKKLLPAASFLILSLFVLVGLRASAPAEAARNATQSDATGGPAASQGLEGRVAVLESELLAEKKRHDETRVLLEQTLVYLDKQSKAAQTLLGALDECEQQGFAVGDNWLSRKTLLAGMRAYGGDAQSGLPKLPAPAPVKPPAPVRPARK